MFGLKKLAAKVILMLSAVGVQGQASQYDCSKPSPEMKGHHNMVLFGKAGDKLYAYHLPLFVGEANGKKGHVLMHVYQGLWEVGLDAQTAEAYKAKFDKSLSEQNSFPFFSFSPRGETFKVPDLICGQKSQIAAVVAYGHVEGNPNFPAPEVLKPDLSQVSVKGKSIFARKFDGSSKEELTYILFGSEKQLYLAHYLSDDENSFDQILAVTPHGTQHKELVSIVEKKGVLVSVPLGSNSNLVPLENGAKKKNNSFSLPVKIKGQGVVIKIGEKAYELSMQGQVYFNKNRDLQK